MSWSFRIGRFFGIDVFVHLTLPLVLGAFVVEAYSRKQDWGAALEQLVFSVVLFAVIVLHEYGHALTARLFGIQTRDILLLPFGGVARLESMPRNSWQELLIAGAGPAVNFVLAGLCLVWFVADGTALKLFEHAQQGLPAPGAPPPAFLTESRALQWFAANVLLALFNLLPAFPLDGGRMLRAILALPLDYVRATWIAARVGQAFAVLLGLGGLYFFGDIWLVLIALFIWRAGVAEAQGVTVRASLEGVRVRQVMSAAFRTLNPFDTLDIAAQTMASTAQLEFPVLHGESFVGLITRQEIAAGLKQLGGSRYVSEVMRRDLRAVGPNDLLLDILPQLRQRGGQSLPVIEGNQLIGLISPTELGAALKGPATAPSAG